jgi:hypothetical protein
MADPERNNYNPDIDKAPKRSTVIKGALIGGICAAILLSNPKEERAKTVDPIVEKYNADKLTRADDKIAFNFLASVSPVQALSKIIKEGKQNFGENLQYNLYLASAGLLSANGGSGAETNQYDLARNLIPKNTQAALHDVGVRFTPVEPVSYWGPAYPYCAANDYTNHTREDFEVKIHKTDNDTILKIPLGTEQQSYEDPVSIEEIMHKPFYSRYMHSGQNSVYIQAEQTPELISVCSRPDAEPSYRTISVW